MKPDAGNRHDSSDSEVTNVAAKKVEGLDTPGTGISEAEGRFETRIGRTLVYPRRVAVLATVLAAGAVIIDALICLYRPWHLHVYRMTLAISGVVCLLCLARGDLASIGLVLRPRRGFRHWIWATALIGVGLVLLLCLICVYYRLTHTPPRFVLALESALRLLAGHCVYYPLVEELLYRVVLCTPLVALLGPWYAIVVSGVAFGGLHVLYGNPAPTNLVAGYLLAWAYIRSDSILVPIVWHSLGNAAILVFQVVAWYVMQ